MLSPQKLPLSAREHFSPAKLKKYDALFHFHLDESSTYRAEYDTQSGTLDFFSKKLAPSRKSFERIISFKMRESDKFQFVSAYYDGSEVSEEWVCEKLTSLSGKSLSASFCDENDDVISSNDDIAVITPDEGASNPTRNLKRKSTFFDLSKLLNISACELNAFLPTFFTASLDAAVEDARPKGVTKTDATAVDQKEKYAIKPILISIEGNIGAGKSFLLAKLRAAHPEWCFIDEPVEFWESLKNDKKESLLEVFYKDQRRWSYTFQNCALLSRFNNIETCISDFATNAAATFTKQQQALSEEKRQPAPALPVPQVFITERCLDTDHEVFAKMLHADGQLDNLEYDLYQRWFNLLGKSATPLSAIVYVDTVPTTCSERITQRSREGEGGIPLAYLTSLDSFQRTWIDSTAVPTVRTLSDGMAGVEAFVDGLVAAANKPAVQI